MKCRFAAHYVYLFGYGYLKSSVVELTDGRLTNIFLLTEEVEDTEWLPGVIAILESPEKFPENAISTFLSSVPCEFLQGGPNYKVYHLYPFDFISMNSVAGTRRRLLP